MGEQSKIIQVLTVHDVKYLGKYIRTEAGVFTLRIHGILARLVDRGIVTLKESGNTKGVELSEWLNNKFCLFCMYHILYKRGSV